MKPTSLLSSLKQSFLNELGSRLEILSFSRKPVGQSFYRKSDQARECIHVSYIPHTLDVDLTIDVSIRINSIEDIVNNFDTKRSETDKRTSMTLGTELGNLAYGQPKRWRLSASDSEQPSKVVIEVIQSVKEIGIPFLERYRNLSLVRQALESNERSLRTLCPFRAPRLMRALAAAYVETGKVDPNQCNSYIEALKEADDFQLSDLRALIRELAATQLPASAGQG